MDVTLWRARPREVPVEKPSAEQSYIPRVLLREDDAAQLAPDGKRRARWMPSEKKPGTSKHLASGQANTGVHAHLEPPETVSELDTSWLQVVEDEIEHLEIELDHFVHDFYVAAASFSAQAQSQKLILQALVEKSKRAHSTPGTVRGE